MLVLRNKVKTFSEKVCETLFTWNFAYLVPQNQVGPKRCLGIFDKVHCSNYILKFKIEWLKGYLH